MPGLTAMGGRGQESWNTALLALGVRGEFVFKEMRLGFTEALLIGLRMLTGNHPGWSDSMAKALGLQSAGQDIQLRGLAGWSSVLKQMQRIGGERTLVFSFQACETGFPEAWT